MKALRLASILLAISVMAGCAHPMIIKPEMEPLAAAPHAERIQKNVGLYISAADMQKEVTTPGGGGDKVTYKPYADLQAGLYKVLGDVFADVSILQAPNAQSAKGPLAYVIAPEIETTSPMFPRIRQVMAPRVASCTHFCHMSRKIPVDTTVSKPAPRSVFAIMSASRTGFSSGETFL